jgi:hypothetical protein
MSEAVATSLAPAALVGPTLPALLNHGQQLATAAPEPSKALAALLADEQLLRTASTSPVTFRPALFWHDDEPVIWPRTVNLIQGQTGVHKSRVAELLGSTLLATLAGRPAPAATLGLGFRPDPGERYRLLYIDTERNLTDQLPYALQQLKARAGYDITEHPPEFYYTSLVRAPRAERFPRLAEYLAHYRHDFDGHLIVILDVLSDCVADYNDVTASLGLIDLLNVAVNEQDATFLAVIHENPGSTAKARGHLGTEASNKASTVLQVSLVKEQGRATGLIQLLYMKRRYAAPGLTFFATFDETTRGLVRADADAPEVQVRGQPAGFQSVSSRNEVLAIMPDLLSQGPVQFGQLVKALSENLGISDSSAKRYLSNAVGGSVADGSGQILVLTKRAAQVGKGVLYSLESYTSPPPIGS